MCFNLRNFYLPILATILGTPLFVYAQGTVEGVILTLRSIVQTFVPFLMTLAIAIFVYGVVKFIAAAGDVQKIKEAKNYIVYGLLGLFVLVAFWGLVWVLAETFGISGASAPMSPVFDF